VFPLVRAQYRHSEGTKWKRPGRISDRAVSVLSLNRPAQADISRPAAPSSGPDFFRLSFALPLDFLRLFFLVFGSSQISPPSWPVLHSADPCDGINPTTARACLRGYHKGYHRNSAGVEWLEDE
jgi:hypothetical protein